MALRDWREDALRLWVVDSPLARALHRRKSRRWEPLTGRGFLRERGQGGGQPLRCGPRTMARHVVGIKRQRRVFGNSLAAIATHLGIEVDCACPCLF